VRARARARERERERESERERENERERERERDRAREKERASTRARERETHTNLIFGMDSLVQIKDLQRERDLLRSKRDLFTNTNLILGMDSLVQIKDLQRVVCVCVYVFVSVRSLRACVRHEIWYLCLVEKTLCACVCVCARACAYPCFVGRGKGLLNKSEFFRQKHTKSFLAFSVKKHKIISCENKTKGFVPFRVQ
jgi:hypothetical protein